MTFLIQINVYRTIVSPDIAIHVHRSVNEWRRDGLCKSGCLWLLIPSDGGGKAKRVCKVSPLPIVAAGARPDERMMVVDRAFKTPERQTSLTRVPTVLEKFWKVPEQKVILESHGEVLKFCRKSGGPGIRTTS